MKLNPNFVLRFIHHLYLLVPIKRNPITKEAILLNNTAVMIFQNCERAQDPAQLAALLANQFCDVSPAEAQARLLPYIESLLENGFLLIDEKGEV